MPAGWTFVFKTDNGYAKINKSRAEKYTHVPGLYIYRSNFSKPYRSVEAAFSKNSSELKKFNPNVIADFNRHIGAGAFSNGSVETSKPTTTIRAPKAARSICNVSAEAFYQHIAAPKPSSQKGALVSSRSCDCENCTKVACGLCANCRSGESANCFQKVR